MCLNWTRSLLERFIYEALLTDEETEILKLRVKGYSITRIAMELNKSESNINYHIAKIKTKYDIVQKEFPDVFPVRK